MKQSDLTPEYLASVFLHIDTEDASTDKYSWVPNQSDLRSASPIGSFSHRHAFAESQIIELNTILNYAKRDPDHPFNCVTDGNTGSEQLRNPVYSILKYYIKHPRKVAIMSKKSRSGIATQVTNYVNIAELVTSLLPKVNQLLSILNEMREEHSVPANSAPYSISRSRRMSFKTDGIQYSTSFKLYQILGEIDNATVTSSDTDTTFSEILISTELFENVLPSNPLFRKAFYEMFGLSYTRSNARFIEEEISPLDMRNFLRFYSSNLCLGVSSILHIILNFFIEGLLINSKKYINSRVTLNKNKITNVFVRYPSLSQVYKDHRTIDLARFIFEYILCSDNSADVILSNINTLEGNFMRQVDKYRNNIVVNQEQLDEIHHQFDLFRAGFNILKSITNDLYTAFLKGSQLEALLSSCDEEYSLDNLAYITAPIVIGVADTGSPQFIQKLNYIFATHTGLTALSTLPHNTVQDNIMDASTLFVHPSTVSTSLEDLVPVFEARLLSTLSDPNSLCISSDYLPRDKEYAYWLLTNHNFPKITRRDDIVRSAGFTRYGINNILGDIVLKSSVFSIKPTTDKDKVTGVDEVTSPFDYRFVAASMFWNSVPGGRNFSKLVLDRTALKYKVLSVLYIYLFLVEECPGVENYGSWDRRRYPKFNCFSVRVEDDKSSRK